MILDLTVSEAICRAVRVALVFVAHVILASVVVLFILWAIPALINYLLNPDLMGSRLFDAFPLLYVFQAIALCAVFIIIFQGARQSITVYRMQCLRPKR